jgi:hypothetical protein
MIEFVETDVPVDLPTGVVGVLPEVLIPMLWWRGIRVLRAAPVSMTPLERFTVELAVTMGRADPEEFFEITGLPGTLLPVAARRLVGSGVLGPSDGGYLPVSPAAEEAMHTQTVYEQRYDSLDVVLLPRTGDVLGLEPRGSWLPDADRLRLRSAGNAPLPADLYGLSLEDHLRARLREGTVAGVDGSVTDVAVVAGQTHPLGRNGWCPSYRCRATLRLDGDQYVPTITLTGRRSKADKELTVTLSGAKGLTGSWLALLDALVDPRLRARIWNTITSRPLHVAPRAERVGPGRWTCWIGADVARDVAERDRNLALPIGIEVRNEQARAELSISLAGADPAAEQLIGLDQALTRAAQPGADHTSVPRTADVRDRAWRLGYHRLVYALREAEDFYHA